MLAPTATSSLFTKTPKGHGQKCEGAHLYHWVSSVMLIVSRCANMLCILPVFQMCQHVVHTACFCSGVLCTAYAEIKISSVENTELTNVLPLKSGLGQNIAMHASPTARNFFLVLISAIPVH